MNSILINFAIFIFGAYLGLELGLMDSKKYPPNRTDKPLAKIDYNLPTKMEESHSYQKTYLGTNLRGEEDMVTYYHRDHTFKNFIDSQNLPTQLQLTMEILENNGITTSQKLIDKIENQGPYSKDTTSAYIRISLNLTNEEVKLFSPVKMPDNEIKIDHLYPLSISFDNHLAAGSTSENPKVIATVYAGDGAYDKYNTFNFGQRGEPTRPTKY